MPIRRIEFHEITEEAVRRAIEEARDIDLQLVDAQESRRIVDRLYGYMVSPVLWKKVQTGLSAGRVQSVAVRLIVEREEARAAFHMSAFWDLEARLRTSDAAFVATLERLGERRLASGKDFDSATGQLKDATVRQLDEAAANARATPLLPGCRGPSAPSSSGPPRSGRIRRSRPPPSAGGEPQARVLCGSDDERGPAPVPGRHHLLPPTDSTTLSDRALREAAGAIQSLYGADFYAGPRQYRTKVKNAQEAHEAIRPTDFGQTPQAVEQRIGSDERRIYELIWKRAVASQMADARLLRTTLEITADGPDGAAVFAASGKAIQFSGFLRAYVEGSDDPAAELGDQEMLLPMLRVGDRLTADGAARARRARAEGHETAPPARYTDASLVKRLEDDGIGRPSTYALDHLDHRTPGLRLARGEGARPDLHGVRGDASAEGALRRLVELGFTGQIEEDLDEISKGEQARDEFLATFYNGGGGRQWPGLRPLVENETQIDYPMIALGQHPETGVPVVVRIGRFGPYVHVGEGDAAVNASIPDDVPPADFTLERAIELIESRTREPTSLGTDPKTGLPVYLMTGRFGPYVQLGATPERGSSEKPRRASLTSDDGQGPISLERALDSSRFRVRSAPIRRLVRKSANFGRFGPYVKRGDEFRSLASIPKSSR